jgi:hypothetical protein
LSDLLCLRYPPSHQCMYGLKRLNIKSQCIHRNFRRDWDDIEKEKIKTLLTQMMEHIGDHKFQYCKGCLIYGRIAPLLHN